MSSVLVNYLLLIFLTQTLENVLMFAVKQKGFMKTIKYRKPKDVMVSNCCGEVDRMIHRDGASYKDALLCPRCKEHCVFVKENDFVE